MLPIYLDNHATTPCDPAVLDAMLPFFRDKFGNAGSRSHARGYAARAATESARLQLASHLCVSPKELVFTSGATEANNLAILGTLRANRKRGDHIITVCTEHKCVLEAAAAAEREGFSVTVLPVQSSGVVDLNLLEQAITDRTVLVSVMWANNEIGVLQPLAEIVKLCHGRDVWVHSDAAQALSTVPLDLRAIPVDLLSLSAHKAYGPMGVGALYVRRSRPVLRVEPLQYGGRQERGLRSGTLPVPLVVGFGAAVAQLRASEGPKLARLRDRLLAGLQAVGGVHLNGCSRHRLPGNLSVWVDGVEAKALQLACKELQFSTGSACTSESLSPSHVLLALGLTKDQAVSTLRVGLGRFTTTEEIDQTIEILTTKITELRALSLEFPGVF